ncbi:glycosyltransferase family 39 protein [Cryobacterium adonitolivorans]|uniref:glycosyltransferase family 39 protein n=1 Tax=Cryobacterium adonitolivorans TaxID=1259189 RepID=UPI00141A7490|nr:glycosyltransferase family 39 protein [Cryobacterium adonitolivorans]
MTMTTPTTTLRRAPDQTARIPVRASVRDALLVGLFGTLLALAWSWQPSIWFDEAATVSATMRSWPELGRMLLSIDAVHGLYYAGMHLWLDLVGYSPFALRLPSAVFVGVAAALTVILVRSRAGRRTAVLAGVALCLLPRVTWMGAEGRSYALTAALAVALTLIFLAAWRRGPAPRRIRVLWWTLYGVIAVVATVTFIYLAFLVGAHGLTALWTVWAGRRRDRAARASLFGWGLASLAAAVLLVPFALGVVGQSGQVSWIAPISWGSWNGVFVTQWFYLNRPFALVGWALVIVGVAALVVAARRSRAAGSETSRAQARNPSLLAIAVPWLAAPTLGVIVASAIATPLYSPRYLTFSAPAVAILIGVALDALRRRWLIVSALVALAGLAAPQFVAQRQPEAKQNSSWSEVADLISRERTARPDDTAAIIYGPVRQHPAATTRVIAYSYPHAFEGLIDVKLKTPAAQTGGLWETRYPLDDVTDRFGGVDAVWLVTSDKQDWRPGVTGKLSALGYTLDEEWSLTGVNVLRYVR